VTTSREALAHVLSCLDAIYEAMGDAAPTLSNDAFVVRAFETARAVGEVALALREYLELSRSSPMDIVTDVLRDAVAGDEEGAMLLFCFAVVVGPRLLVSLRDAREEVSLDEGAMAVANLASEVLVAEILAVGEAAQDLAPVEDERWQERARGLTFRLEAAGYAESMGVSH
jgi:hypothetical protein